MSSLRGLTRLLTLLYGGLGQWEVWNPGGFIEVWDEKISIFFVCLVYWLVSHRVELSCIISLAYKSFRPMIKTHACKEARAELWRAPWRWHGIVQQVQQTQSSQVDDTIGVAMWAQRPWWRTPWCAGECVCVHILSCVLKEMCGDVQLNTEPLCVPPSSPLYMSSLEKSTNPIFRPLFSSAIV